MVESSGRTGVCAGIVDYADLALGAPAEKVLEAMIAAGGIRFRGIRFITASHPDQAVWGSAIIRRARLAVNSGVREEFARLAALGLSFNAWMYHTQPGSSRIKSGSSTWRAPLPRHKSSSTMSAGRSDLPNAPANCGRAPRKRPSSEKLAAAWRPYIEICIAAFGP